MITIEGNSIKDPTSYNDNYDQFFADSISLGLKRQRNRRGKLKFAEMGWDLLTPDEINALLALFIDGDQVDFVNTASSFGTFSFTGRPDLPIEIGDYEPGGTYLRPLRIVLREV